MAGLYIHIPFCKQACYYCNFHFSTSLRLKNDLIAALCKELHLRKPEGEDVEFNTVYFGGGTPSLLDSQDFELIWSAIDRNYLISQDAEITLEANPDDLTREKLNLLKSHRINRLSIGVQSFFDQDLKYMNRAHNAREARTCIELSQDAGIDNISIDLIYGTPTLSDTSWQQNLDLTSALAVPHISAYQLTVEPKTPLEAMIKRGKANAPVDEFAVRQFKALTLWARAHGIEHYEISNLAKPGFRSKHNSSYWSGESYIGVGPSAHSFDGINRRWNIAHNPRYIKMLEEETDPVEGVEKLTQADRYNETIMTGLRLAEGVQFGTLETFPEQYRQTFLAGIQSYIESGKAIKTSTDYRLSDEGRVFADRIASDCFVTD